jgi:hypothetical protein
MDFLRRKKLFSMNQISDIVMHVAKRTFYNSIRYLEHQELVNSANFIKPFLGQVSLFDNKKGGYFQFAMNKVTQDKKGLWLEFGVRSGVSAKFFAPFAKDFAKNSTLYGFDSFEGIRNDWSSIDEPAGSFTLNAKVPEKIKNCEFVVGWVEDTLDKFLNIHQEVVNFAHFDLDVYEPTKFALSAISDRLVPGSIVMFDEFHGYPGWEFHEKKALEEVLPRNKYEFIAFSRKQATIRII